MKTKGIIITFCIIFAVAFAVGASGVVDFSGIVREDVDGIRLIGVLVTRESIDPEEYNDVRDWARISSSGEEVLIQADQPDHQGRHYAKLVEMKNSEGVIHHEYVFEDIDGLRCCDAIISYVENGEVHEYTTSLIDVGVTDAQIKGGWKDVSIQARIILSIDTEDYFWFNPVYQTAKGSVFAVQGECVFLRCVVGPEEDAFRYTLRMKENNTQTEESDNSSQETEIKLSFSFVDVPESVQILQFNNRNELLDKMEISEDSRPETIMALPGTQYMIVETETYRGINRTLYQRDDQLIYSFQHRGDGICIKHSHEIIWND